MTAFAQPGGSMRDAEVVAAVDAAGGDDAHDRDAPLPPLMARRPTSLRRPALARPDAGRDPNEAHRTRRRRSSSSSTCASSSPSRRWPSALHHDLVEGQIAHGVISYVFVFFAIWWPWMNFTWFASAYDTDDVQYRLLTFVQIAGVLVVAAGVPVGASTTLDYTVDRHRLRHHAHRAGGPVAARRARGSRHADPSRSASPSGIALVQVGWVAPSR